MNKNDKLLIWGFYGIGKSNVRSDLRVIDADSMKFQFVNVSDDDLKCRNFNKKYFFNDDYPDNYIQYVNSTDADIVLINCHLNLLKFFSKENLILVYPTSELKEEYLQRYRDRGDTASFIEYMAETFEEQIAHIDKSEYFKIKITENNIYLNDLLQGADNMNNFMTKAKVTELFDEAVKYEVFSNEINGIKHSSQELAQMAFDGEIKVDFNVLQKDIKSKLEEIEKARVEAEKVRIAKEKALKQEKLAAERRCGFSRKELADKIMQGIVNGTLGIAHGQIAPYSYGYEVTFGGDCPIGSTRDFKNRWECYCSFFDIPNKIVEKIEMGHQNGEVFGKSPEHLDLIKMINAIDEMENKKITTYIPEKDTDFKRAVNSYTYPYRSSVASVSDVHTGKGLDGIVKHHYHGDYSSITTSNYNSLVETLVYLKGFCLDCLETLNINTDTKQNIINYLKKHGTDISTPEKLQAWIKNNPEKCGLEENRKIDLDYKIKKAESISSNGNTPYHHKEKDNDLIK